MTLAPVADAVLILLLLALALWILLTPRAFAASVGFVAYGLLVALAWVRLGSVDVALTEAAIGSGLSGLLLLGASRRLAAAPAGTAAGTAERPPGLGLKLAVGALCLAVALGLGALVLALPEPAPNLVAPALAGLPTTGLGNPVTGVLVAYRAIDTLMESVVLALAVVAVWSLAPDRAWGGRPGSLTLAAPTPALTFLAQVLPPLGILVGIHLFWTGANHPGGAFQGGTVLAAMWLLAALARLVEMPRVTGGWIRLGVVLGPLVFLLIGLAGMPSAGAFLGYPDGLAKPLILLIETGLTLSIALALGLLLAGPPAADPAPRQGRGQP
jgi:multisubunit Na+/H+ antiporter MnhB subunit